MAIEERDSGADAARLVRTPVAQRTHRVHCFAGRAHEVLDDLLGVDGDGFVSLSELGVSATRESIVELSRVQDRIEALKAKLLDHGDILSIGTAPDENGDTPAIPATTTAAWYAGAVRIPARAAKQTVKVARRLEDAFHATRRALGSGHIDADQAAVIVEAVDALPDIVVGSERRHAEQHLLGLAATYDAQDLKKLARHLLDVIDPDGLDEYLAKKLDEEEARAARTCFLDMRDDGMGTVHGRFALPGLNADMLAVAVNDIASPKRPDALDRERPVSPVDGASDAAEARTEPVPTPELLGQAFCEYIERFPADKLPVAGGISATVVVTMEVQTLLGGLKPATLDTGRRITGGEARRLASQCGVIPAVFDTPSALLDMGRKIRLHNAAQRIALRITHKNCTADGCTIPAAWCHAHHKTPWASGGRTSVKDGTLLCPRHHRLVHRPGYDATYDGAVTRISKTVKRRQ